jgi:hypothetical protein
MYLMSAPAANALLPAPVRTITRTAASFRSSVRRSRSSPRVSTSSAFIASGRSMVTTATAASSWTWTVKASLATPPSGCTCFAVHQSELTGRLVCPERERH